MRRDRERIRKARGAMRTLTLTRAAALLLIGAVGARMSNVRLSYATPPASVELSGGRRTSTNDRARLRSVALQRGQHVAGIEVQLEQPQGGQTEIAGRKLHRGHGAVAKQPFER